MLESVYVIEYALVAIQKIDAACTCSQDHSRDHPASSPSTRANDRPGGRASVLPHGGTVRAVKASPFFLTQHDASSKRPEPTVPEAGLATVNTRVLVMLSDWQVAVELVIGQPVCALEHTLNCPHRVLQLVVRVNA